MSMQLKVKPILGMAAAAGLLYAGYAYLYAAPKAKLLKELGQQQKAVEGYEAALKRRVEIRSGLKAVADSTLGATKDDVDSRFRTGLYSVAAACDLRGISANTREPVKEVNPLGKAKLSSGFASLKRELRGQTDFYSISGELTATGTLDQVLRATAMVRQQPWVHRVQSFELKPAGDEENARFTLRLGVSTLLLTSDLAPKERGEPVVLALAEGADSAWQGIVRKNVFREPPAPEKPKPAVANVEKPAPAPATPQRPLFEEWKLTGVVQSRLGIEAFLVNVKNGQRLSLPTGAAIADAKFVSGEGERAVFEIGGERFEITNGQTLEHRRPLTR